MTATTTGSARNPGWVTCPTAGCTYTMPNAGSVPAHLAMAHPEVPMDAIAPKRGAVSEGGKRILAALNQLTFELAGHRYLFRIPRPTTESLHAQWVADGKSPTTTKYLPSDSQVAAEWRRRWRSNVLLLKAKLEFAEGEASTVVRELMPYALPKDGRTLEEAIVSGSGSVPLLETGR